MKTVIVAGSYRRMRETVGDFDILVAAANGDAVISAFCSFGKVKQGLARGQTRAAVVLNTRSLRALKPLIARTMWGLSGRLPVVSTVFTPPAA